MRDVGKGTKVFDAAPVRGRWRFFESPDDVIAMMDEGATDVIAGVHDAGATFLAPIFDDLIAVVCFTGTPMSHIGIVSREYQVPAVMATQLDERPVNGTEVEVDCSGATGVVRMSP